jgi:putative isomerase
MEKGAHFMIKKTMILIVAVGFSGGLFSQEMDWRKYSDTIKKYIYKDYKGMFRPAGGLLKYPFLTPGSSQYADVLWDWDSWLSNVALRQVLWQTATREEKANAAIYERGSVLNFLSVCSQAGWIPILIKRGDERSKVVQPANVFSENMHKPCLAQYAAFLCQADSGKAEWLREDFYSLQRFVNNYINHHRNKATGLYYWQNDVAIGVDNDPATFNRPPKSSGSIFLNCMMYKELLAMVYLSNQLNLKEIGAQFEKEAANLKNAIQENCWDERDGFFYSVDLNLVTPTEEPGYVRHSGMPRNWDCLIQRLGVWSGFLGMWADIATPEQAKRIVAEHFSNKKTFNSPAGIRTLSKMEKMYNVKASGNPSSWLGPVWGISNYLTWKGLVKYGFIKEARELAAKTVVLFGRDFERFGALHEYYEPDNGEPILNKGFQNWNFLVLNMLAWLEGGHVISEF